jgi:hypothetical protein
VIFTYLFSYVVRHFGRHIEENLWSGWGGPPSTRILRWNDPTFGENLKQRLHTNIEQKCGIKLLCEEEESLNMDIADSRIEEAFTQVVALVRRNDPNGLGLTHNAEYGFLRNLLGSRSIWLLFAVVGSLVCGILWLLNRGEALLVGFSLNSLFALGILVFGWTLLPISTKAAADRYAVSMWTTFLAISDSEKKK